MRREKMTVSLLAFLAAAFALVLAACAGERQGVVCSEIQYRLDTQTYSVWKKHGDIIYKLCAIKCASTEEAKDLFQTVALKFCRNAMTLMSGGDALGWIVKVLHNTYLDSVPARDRFSPMSYVAERRPDYEPFRMEDSAFFSPPGGADVAYLLDKVSPILNPVEKMILDMTFLGGISTDMQCNILGLSKNAIRKRRYFALKKIRNMMEADSDGALNDATRSMFTE